MEALGRRPSPFAVDVRDDERVEAMVRAALERFGRIDFLVNNAGALYWQDVEDTPHQRYDLVHGGQLARRLHRRARVHPRHAAAGLRAHPQHEPADQPRRRPARSPTLISKHGMTLLTIGLGGELQGSGVACNALWPETMIESYATIKHHLGEPADWRRPEILVDATIEIFSRDPHTFTGRALIDETFLREECGVSDFARYRCDPAVEPPKVGLDFRIRAGRPEHGERAG